MKLILFLSFSIMLIRIHFILSTRTDLYFCILLLYYPLAELAYIELRTSSSLERDHMIAIQRQNQEIIQFVDDTTFREADFCFASGNENAYIRSRINILTVSRLEHVL